PSIATASLLTKKRLAKQGTAPLGIEYPMEPLTSVAASDPQKIYDLADEQLIDAEVDSVPTPRTLTPQSALGRFILGASLVLIAFNLRPVFSSASALLPEIIRSYGLSPVGASLLTTLPVVCLGAFSPVAPRLAQRIGAERTLLGVLALLAIGT